MRRMEVNGGSVITGDTWRLILPPTATGYADAQIDDYGRISRRAHYPWSPGTRLSLRARFTPDAASLRGTAGFGFWNAPFGDPDVRWPALPQAAWFFYASPPNELPFAPNGSAQGWFAATVDAGRRPALAHALLAPLLPLSNRLPTMQQKIWDKVRTAFAISYAPLTEHMDSWHTYELVWLAYGCWFSIDGRVVHQTHYSPRGPLGFVCWVDNQYLIATPQGRLRWGTVSTVMTQTLEIAGLTIGPSDRQI